MMASACVNNVGMSTESAFLDFAPACPAYGWLSPRISFSRGFSDADATDLAGDGYLPSAFAAVPSGKPDAEAGAKDLPDFEFRLDNPVAILPADELFSDGKLVPLHLAAVRPALGPADEIRLQGAAKPQRTMEVVGSDPYEPSPRPPKCSSRWRELFGLKKHHQSQKSELQNAPSVLLCSKSLNLNSKSLRHILHRHQPSSGSSDTSLSLPLLRDSDLEPPISISGRRSLSSSSSSTSAGYDDLPRLSLDLDKPVSHAHAPISISRVSPRVVRLSRPRSSRPEIGRTPARRLSEAVAGPPTPLAATVESPRMNASGRVVFQGLERSSSSPGSFNGGPRLKYRGMERSYSANVRVKPVLNVVPVGSLRGSAKSGSVFGFGHLFSQPKKEKEASTAPTARVSGSKIKLEKLEDPKRTNLR